jgi:putative ABC transport system permease protein
MVVIANIIALPLAWYLMNNWLSNFPYRVTISWWMFAIALSTGVVIAFCTIAIKTVKAAYTNPVEVLRSE